MDFLVHMSSSRPKATERLKVIYRSMPKIGWEWWGPVKGRRTLKQEMISKKPSMSEVDGTLTV